ncbi:MAG: NAD(P)H-dependent oxidoreductase [Pirellulaceae bacterium]
MPTAISPDALLSQLRWRYATKRFDPTRKIPDQEWRTLEEALILTPSSFGLQPWKFVVITDPAVKAQLPAISWNQRQVLEASHTVVFARRLDVTEEFIDRNIRRIVEVRGGTVEGLAGFKKMLMGSLVPPPAGFDLQNWAALQCYIALGNFMTSAAVLGIDTCPMEGIVPAKYDELLGLTAKGFATVVVGCAGYRSADDKYASAAKVRFPAEEMIERV